MFELTYIFHSGFAISLDDTLLVFDYWLDPSDAMSRIAAATERKHVYFFASHFHQDHFTRDIFKLKSLFPRATTSYILSKDILRRRRAAKDEADVWLAKGGEWTDGRIKVAATGSNDSGVSWVVEASGRRIFHAGDLGNWYARFLAEDNPPGSAYSEEFGVSVNPVAEEKRYLGELKDIAKLTTAFDIAMVPVDGRIGNGFTLGARQFIERFSVGLLVPIHFAMSGPESTWRMVPFCQEAGVGFWRIRCEGDSITIE